MRKLKKVRIKRREDRRRRSEKRMKSRKQNQKSEQNRESNKEIESVNDNEESSSIEKMFDQLNECCHNFVSDVNKKL